MFPNIMVNVQELSHVSDQQLGKVFLFDHSVKRHILEDGKLKEATELEAVKQWIELLLRTYVDHFPIYDGTYFGLSTLDLIGQKQFPLMMLQAMIEQEIKEKAVNHVLIRNIVGFRIERNDIGLSIYFTVILKNGNTQGVNVHVK